MNRPPLASNALSSLYTVMMWWLYHSLSYSGSVSWCQLAEEVLIAGGLAGIEVALVEARAFEPDIAAFGIDLATRDLWLTHRPAPAR